jgi:uncharacterized protein YbaP (TraB family)
MNRLLIGLFVVVACLSCRSVRPVEYPVDELVPKARALLWKIQGNGLRKPSYLFGTIHLIPKSDLVFSEYVISAVGAVDYIVFEIDMKEMTNFRTQLSLLTKSMMPAGMTLAQLLSDEDYAFVRSSFEQSGLPWGIVERLKPMFSASLLSDGDKGAVMGNTQLTSVEMEIWKLAKKRKLPSAGLETAAYQMSVFDSIPYAFQAQLLLETLRGGQAGADDFASLVSLYKQQDIDAMQRTISDSGAASALYEDVLLFQRNRNWIPVMRDIMRRQPSFFAVGAGHLGGPSGVIALLREAGFSVEPIHPQE